MALVLVRHVHPKGANAGSLYAEGCLRRLALGSEGCSLLPCMLRNRRRYFLRGGRTYSVAADAWVGRDNIVVLIMGDHSY